jgi:hypothetical protein
LRSAGRERLAKAGKARPEDLENWSERELWIPSFSPSRFVGATGAGDASFGAFLCALLRDESIEDAGRFANAVGACNVEAPDALSGLRSWERTWRRLRASWPQNALAIDAPGWRFSSVKGIWLGPNDTKRQGAE